MSGLPRPSGLQPLKTYKKSTTKVTSGGTSTTNITETTTSQSQRGQGQRTLYAQPIPRGPSSTAGMSRIGQPASSRIGQPTSTRIGQPASSRTTTTNVNIGGNIQSTSTTTKQYGAPQPSRLPSSSRLPSATSSRLPAPPSRIGRPQPPQGAAPPQPRIPRSQIGQQLSQGYPSTLPVTGQPQGLPSRLPAAPRTSAGIPRSTGGIPRAPGSRGALPKVVEKKSSKMTNVVGGETNVTTTSSTNITQGGVQQYYHEESRTEKEGAYPPRRTPPQKRRSLLDIEGMISAPKLTPPVRGQLPPLKDYRLEPPQPGLVQDDYDQGVELQDHVEKQLLEATLKAPRKKLKATGTKQTIVKAPQAVAADGTVLIGPEVIMKKSVIRPVGGPEIISHHMASVQPMGGGQALRTDLEVQKLSPKKKPKKDITDREVISVTDIILTSPGMKLTQKTVTYDAPERSSREEEPPLPSVQEVAHLIEEESAEVEKTLHMMMPDLKASRPVTYGIRKVMGLQQLTADSVTLLEQVIPPTIPNADECQDEPPPELIATIMNTEENGPTMSAHPSNMHKYLFPDVADTELMVEVNSAMVAPLQNVVVPSHLPATLKAEMQNNDVMAAAVEIEAKLGAPIPDNIYVETVGKPTGPPKNTARAGKRKKKEKPLAEEVPPWGNIDVEPLADVTGASLGISLPDESKLGSPEVDIEYLLQMEAPQHTSRVQLRGSTHPSWFPGYLLALPDLSELITVVKSPSVVFTAAWRATQPDIFADENLLVV